MNKALLLAATALVCLVGTIAASAGTDSYVVDRPAYTLPNGVTIQARSYRIERPTPGTFVPGIVIVQTRASYGVGKGDRTLAGSPLNQALASSRVRDIGYASFEPGAAQLNSMEARMTGLNRLYSVRYDEPIEPFDLCKRLMSNPDVEYATPLFMHNLTFTPNDPRFVQQGALTRLRAAQAWDVTKGSPDVLIAIIDSGTDYEHEDLAPNIWTNTKEIPNNNVDDDQNGYVDDVRGWDFVGNVSYSDVMSGILRPDNDPKVRSGTMTDVLAHGTATAGCASAATNNGKGIASVGFGCRIIPIKCGSDNPQITAILQGYQAIRYAADLGADVINCSWGGAGSDPSAQSVIDYAVSKGAVVVAATGNVGANMDVTPFFPASAQNVLAVGSVSDNDIPSGFSNYGWGATTYAPGENVLSTYPGNQYRGQSGTSFSCPIVSGICGLVKSVHPDWTPLQIIQQVRSTSDVISSAIDRRQQFYGRANAERAVKVNASWTTGERLPGLYVSATQVSPGAAITSYDNTTVQFTLSNALADAPNTVVSIQPFDVRTRVMSGTDVNVGTVAHNGTATGSFTVKLADNYPWYEDNARFGLTIRSGNYVNYHLIEIPVRLSTSNSQSILQMAAEYDWNSIRLTADGSLWATGRFIQAGGVPVWVRAGSSGGTNLNALPFVPTAIDAVDASTAFIGGSASSSTTIIYTTSGGAGWGQTNVGNIAASVEGIRMYNANEGIFVGNPAGSKFGVGRTTNGGQTWTEYGTRPQVTNGETIVPGSVFFHGDSCWFASSTNRIVRTTNKGQVWASAPFGISGARIVSLAFRDGKNGIALYRTSSSTDAPYRFAASTDAGQTWKATQFYPSTLGFVPVGVMSPGGHHVLLGNGGEVFGSDDNGASWQPILSRPAGWVTYGTATVAGARPTIVMAGQGLSMLQYRYSGPNGSRILAFNSNTLDLGDLNPGQTRVRYAQIHSSGESAVRIDSTVISIENGPADGLVVAVGPGSIIEPGASKQVGVRLTASDTGTYRGTLRIFSNAAAPIISIPVTGRVQAAVSVEEDAVAGIISVAPNPAADVVTIRTGIGATLTLQLVDTRGAIVRNVRSSAADGHHRLDVSDLAPGMYRLVITGGPSIRTVPLVLTR
ncbi:MAG: S8 family serine peptidase ['Candidatus Kapabacteria' thiocyanatum]|uniref:Peptidase S8/S53 domain-containing protein n=1 Tax=Candidatus Kapaibacterium thiocyanatum TaxID=1895771 RepID=A0A1M3KW73_9BACT|nr:S8 family serine peptidase ['Candidatus Kapabacteria' thiocyanatum]OJX56640.1 MAG: hypothetical protein BGO89_08815 ['Candidatus Kapabacteria' thiocyanatum]